MGRKQYNGRAVLPKNREQWELFQQLGNLSKDFKKLRDAETVMRDKRRSAPLPLLLPVF